MVKRVLEPASAEHTRTLTVSMVTTSPLSLLHVICFFLLLLTASATMATNDTVSIATECGPPPNITNAFQSNSTNATEYNNQTEYRCYSGHDIQISKVGVSSFNLTCSLDTNDLPVWKSDGNLTDDSCYPSPSYLGCFATNDSMQVIAGTYSPQKCKTACRELHRRFAALKGGLCACTDVFLSDPVGDTNCSMVCDKDQTQLCGGDPDFWSVYTPFVGCYTNLTEEETFESLNKVTCTEVCRGQESVFAAYSSAGRRCACYNYTVSGLVREPQNQCDSDKNAGGVQNGTMMPFFMIFLPRENQLNAKTCKELFAKGVYLHGSYYLSGDSEKTVCNFYDGSVACKDRWLGYNGHCYYISDQSQSYTFQSAWEFCVNQDSMLVTINNQAEIDFLSLAQSSVTALGTSDDYFLGLYDQFNIFAYQWLDGSLQDFTNFEAHEPNLMELNCIYYDQLGTAKLWYDADCATPHGFVCERSTGMYGCIEIPVTMETPVYTFENAELMTLTLCFEKCRSSWAVYAAVVNTTCQCWASLPAHSNVTWAECTTPCPGNQYQLCGNEIQSANNTIKAFVIQDVGQAYADSCVTLEMQGITGNNLAIQNNSVIMTVDCSPPSGMTCPYAWANINGHCYRYFMRTATNPDTVCRTMDGYLVMLDNSEEEQAVFGNPSVLKDHSAWIIGLFTSGPGPNLLMRASNGRNIQGLPLPLTDTGDERCVRYNTDTDEASRLTRSQCTVPSFVCEAGLDYIGCGVVPGTYDMAFTDYPEMSVTMCIELCRGRGQRYASVGGTGSQNCFCTEVVPDKAPSAFYCNNFCFFGSQACGAPGYVSVYNIEQYPVFANSCSDLFDTGILSPGVYLIDGVPTYCYMKDNSSCSTADSSSWVSVGVNNSCFKWSLDMVTEVTAPERCKSLSPYHRLASIRTEEELNFLVSLSYMLKQAYKQYRVQVGGKDQFLMGTFTWLDGWLLKWNTSYWSADFPVLNYGENGPITRTTLSLSYDGKFYNADGRAQERRFICREIPDNLGCFINPTTLEAAIQNYSSMSIGLCKQKCLAINTTIALLDTTSCYCLSDVASLSAIALNDDDCNMSCPANSFQECASPGFLRAYAIDPSDVADSCDILHANFILLRDEYMVKDSLTGDLVPTQCGFADSTACPAGFLSKQGKCYHFFPWTYRSAEQAAQQCHDMGAYLATPINSDEATFFSDVVKGVPSLATFNKWRLGMVDTMHGETAMSSDGSHLTTAMWNLTSMAGNGSCSVLNVQNNQVEAGECLTTLPFICEIAPVFQGCLNSSTPINAAVTFNLSLTSTTVQQCVALCRVEDSRYAVLSSTLCSCTNTDVMTANNQVVNCQGGCRDYFSQVCGSHSMGIQAVFDIDAYNESQISSSSCRQYRQMQVMAIGKYYLRLSAGGKLLVSCGLYGLGHEDILTLEGSRAEYSASSSKNASAQEVRLQMETPMWTTWQPKDNDAQSWIQVTFSDYYVVKTIVITGAQSSDGGHVSKMSLSYGLSADKMSVHNDIIEGPSHRTDLAVRFLSMPVVAKVVQLEPITWSVEPSMAVTFLGQLYANFSHSDRYIGCFADPANTTLVSLTDISTVEECRDNCKNQSYPLFGLVEVLGAPKCGCSNAIGEYGELESTACNATCSTWQCGNSVAMSVAIYRAYDKKCSPPVDVINSTRTVTPLVPAPDDVFGVGSTVTYSCLVGYELPDLMHNLTISCQNDDMWSETLPPACNITECGSPPAILNGIVSYSDTTYGSKAVYSCIGDYGITGSEVTYCSEDKMWTPSAPECNTLRAVREQNISLCVPGTVISGNSVSSVSTRSGIECALRCIADNLCKTYSFRASKTALSTGTDNCMLHLGVLSDPTFVTDTAWNVFRFGDTC